MIRGPNSPLEASPTGNRWFRPPGSSTWGSVGIGTLVVEVELGAERWPASVPSLTTLRRVRVLSGSPEVTIDRTWETRCSAGTARHRNQVEGVE